MMSKFSSSRVSNQTSSANSTSSSKTTVKKGGDDLTTMYGADFARAVAANQFLNGGSLNDAISRVKRDNEKAARRRAEKMGVPYIPDATAPVRGPGGELFRDAQEESERRGLLRNVYKGMSESSTTSRSKSEIQVADDDEGVPSSQSSHQRSSAATSRHENARADFFASSFVPVPTRR